MLKIKVCAASNVGCKRQNNEDNYYFNHNNVDSQLEANNEGVFKDFFVGAVCDGMGGEDAGEVASLLAVRSIEKFEELLINSRFSDSAIEETVLFANEAVCEGTRRNGKRMGTTLALIGVTPDEVTLSNVGDSRIYIYSNGFLEQLSHDHTEAQTMVDSGIVSKEESMNLKEKHRLTQHLGIFSYEMLIEPYTVRVPVYDKDRFLLCSDGLTDMLTEDEIKSVFDECLSVSDTADKLINRALENGGKDNVTVMICEVSDEKVFMDKAPVFYDTVDVLEHNKEGKEKKKNGKLNKWIKAIITTVSAVALIFAAVITVVVVRDYRRTLLVIDPPESTTSVYENSAGWAPGEDDYAEENIIPDYILLGDQSLIYFEDFVMSKSVRYCDYAEYKSKIGYVDTLDFLLNISGSDDTANIQDLLLEDIDKVFELFDMNEKSEKEEFHKMLYFMDVIQQDSESFSEEFDVNSKDPFLTMTKIFYRNLARNINSESVTLQDAYYLMRVFESDLDRHMANNNIDNLILFKDFYPGYLQIQDKFFEVISKENHVDLEEIRIGFENYSENAVYSEYMGCSLDFLTEEQKNAVIDFCSGFYRKGFPSMKSAKEHCDELVLKTE